MDTINSDDMLIQMIEPRVDEIKTRFAENKKLDNGDISLLLLKSQHRHINHVDQKLNEVTADVAALKLDFAGLRGDFKRTEEKNDHRFKLFKEEVNNNLKLFETNLDLKIAEALNKNIRWSIASIALIVTLLKLADAFLP